MTLLLKFRWPKKNKEAESYQLNIYKLMVVIIVFHSQLSTPQGPPYWTLQATELFQLSTNHAGLFKLKVSYQDSNTNFNNHDKILQRHW